MPRIRRWHPVSHDFNRDPEVQDLRHAYGQWMGYVWLEMLSIADKNEGRIKGDRASIAASLAWVSLSGRPSYSRDKILTAIDYMIQKGWIEEGTGCLLVRNYSEYHRTREHKKSQQGTNKVPLLSYPSEPSSPSERTLPNSPPIRSPKGPNGFEALWRLYPGRKGSKADALKAYLELRPPEEALEALKTQMAYKAECEKRGVFCEALPHAHRWLKKRRWEDELPPFPESQAERLWREAQEEKAE